jgi:putative phosphoesterase
LRVAALYDVHGNLPALQAVLVEVEREGVDEIVFGGDIASGPPLPRETVELVRSLPNARAIRGNADRLDSPAFRDDPGRLWVEQRLAEEQIAWLAELPFSTVLDDTLYVHATPQDDESVITELTSDERLAELLAGVEQRRIVTGHTHMQLERRSGDVLFVNAGSVGRPYEGRPGAYWALLDDDTVVLRRTEYDLESAAEGIRASGHPRAEELAAENVLQVPSRAEALAVFGG